MKYLVFFFYILALQSCETYPKAPECKIPQELLKSDLNKQDYVNRVFSYLVNSNPEEYRYFFKTFLEGKDSTSMVVNFRNEHTCFDVEILVQDWSILSGMRKVNGKSYPKELRNLKWKLIDNQLVEYVGMDNIID